MRRAQNRFLWTLQIRQDMSELFVRKFKLRVPVWIVQDSRSEVEYLLGGNMVNKKTSLFSFGNILILYFEFTDILVCLQTFLYSKYTSTVTCGAFGANVTLIIDLCYILKHVVATLKIKHDKRRMPCLSYNVKAQMIKKSFSSIKLTWNAALFIVKV